MKFFGDVDKWLKFWWKSGSRSRFGSRAGLRISDFYSSRATFLTYRRGVHENNIYIEDRRSTDRPTTDQPTSHFGKFRMAISRQRIIRSTSSLVLGQGFRGRRIECLYFRLDQIQDRGRQPSCIILNGHISETVHPIQFVFGSKVKVQEQIMREE